MNMIRAGTRKSALATWQTQRVLDLLVEAHAGLRSEVIPMDTTGDLNQHDPLPSIGAKGLFTAELEAALRGGAIDIAVHSLKDLPTRDADGLVVGAVLDRADVRDVLVLRGGLRTLPPSAVVGTSSMRRAAQIRMLRPDVQVESIRGNVQTRIEKVERGAYDGAVMAAAGLVRMGLEGAISEWFETGTMLPAPGQGALAVQCRQGDDRVLALLEAIHDVDVARATTAERAFLAALEGGCSSPVAAYAVLEGSSEILLEGLVAAPSGENSIRVIDRGEDPEALGRSLAQLALERGAARLVRPSTVLTEEVTTAEISTATATAPAGAGRLRGWRVVVTRAANQAEPLCRALQAEGATPVAIPGIQIQPIQPNTGLRAAVSDLAVFDWVICTSTNGVEVLFDALAAEVPATGGDAPWPRGVRAAAVGSQTAEAFRLRGVKDVVVPEEFTGHALARMLAGPGLDGGSGDERRNESGDELGGVEGARVLLVQASAARPDLAGALRAAGAQLKVVAAYHTAEAPTTPEHRKALEAGVEALTFTSPSTARAFRSQFGDLAESVAAGAVVAAIGPVTARAVEELGWPVHVVADPHTIHGLVEGLSHAAEKRTGRTATSASSVQPDSGH